MLGRYQIGMKMVSFEVSTALQARSLIVVLGLRWKQILSVIRKYMSCDTQKMDIGLL